MIRRPHRRAVAILAILALGIFMAEPLAADACDRDGRVAEWSLGGPAPDSYPEAPTPTHTLHVCHCVHGHVGGLASPQAVPATVVITLTDLVQPIQGVVGRTLQPRLRPPIS